MLASEVVERVRIEVQDVEEDYIWPTTVVYEAIARAQNEYALRALALFYTEVLVIVDGENAVTFPQRMFRPITLTYAQDRFCLSPGPAPASDATSGRPRAFYHYANQITVYPATNGDLTFSLSGYSYPRIDPSADHDELEITEEAHTDLITGAAYFLQSVVDGDVDDQRRLRMYAQRWQEALKRGYDTSQLRTHKTEPIQYGGY